MLYSLGIYRLGREVSGLLAERYASVDQVAPLTLEELTAIPGVGPKIAESVVNGFENPRIKTIIAGLKEGGVKMEQEIKPMNNVSNTWTGKTFVVTGQIEGMTRSESEYWLTSLPGQAVIGVNYSCRLTMFTLGGSGYGTLFPTGGVGIPRARIAGWPTLIRGPVDQSGTV